MQQPTHDPTGYGAKQGAGVGPGSDAPAGGRTPASGARTAGALICVILLGVEIAWTVRDINAIGFHDTLWRWLGLTSLSDYRIQPGVPVTSVLDGVLIVLLLGGVVASRRSSASGAHLTIGLFAVLFRLPGLWEFNADWSSGLRYHDRLLSTALAFVVLGAALIVVALVSRRPSAFAARGGPADGPAARPRAGAAVAAGLLLLVVAAETVGWQFFFIHHYSQGAYPHGYYKHLITGHPTTLLALLTPASGWVSWVTVALAVLAAVLAFRRDAMVRPLTMALALHLGLGAVVVLDRLHEAHVLFSFDDLPASENTWQCFLVFEVVAAVLLVLLAAFRESPWRVPPAGPIGPVPGWGYGLPPAPPAPPPGSWGGYGSGLPAPGPPAPPGIPPQPGGAPGTFGPPPPPYPPPGVPPTP